MNEKIENNLDIKNKKNVKKNAKARNKNILVFTIALGLTLVTMMLIWFYNWYNQTTCKPVIYLYPKETKEVKVKLEYNGEIFAHYPDYSKKIKGWEIKAYPDGKIINHADKKEYSYLFWEGHPKEKINYDLSTGFVVEGKNTKKFLQEKLSEIGLTSKEYNEFIVYWFPKMQDNKYNLIHFAGKNYTDSAKLTIEPKEDSMLRVFMVWKKLDKKIKIPEQKIENFNRKGFAVVEWGGTELE